MEYNILKKVMITGLSTTMLIGGISLADLPSCNTNIVEKAYAATIKDIDFIASGTIKSNVSMRKGPGTSYDRGVTLKKGTKVDIVAKSSNGWYKINYKDGYGYVYSDFVNVKDDNETNKDTDYNATAVANHDVYVRKGASTSFSKLGTLRKGDKVTIVAKSSNGWYKINYKDSTGYVYGKYITVNKDDDKTYTEVKYNAKGVTTHKIYARKGPSTSSDKLGVLDNNVKVNIVAKTSNGWYKINYKDGYAYVLGDYIKISSIQDTKYNATAVANHDVYVRKGASTSFSKLGTLRKGDKVTIVAKSSNGWYKINYKNGYGYVYGKYLTLDNNNQDVKYPVKGVANHDVYIRKSGSPSAKKLGILWKNTKVSLLAKTSNGWYKINYKDGYGYVYSQYVNVISQK